MSADGETIVAWHVGPRARGVSLCIRPASGGPCAVQRVSLPGRRAILQSLFVDVDGSAIVAWVQQTARGWRAAVAERAAGGAFGRARLVGPRGATTADVALGPASATLVFSRTPARRRGAAQQLGGPAGELAARGGAGGHVGPVAARPCRDRAARGGRRSRRRGRGVAAHAWRQRVRDRVRAHPRLRPGGLLERPGRARALRAAAPARPAARAPRAQASTADLSVSATGERLVIGWIHLSRRRAPRRARSVWRSGPAATLGAAVRGVRWRVRRLRPAGRRVG